MPTSKKIKLYVLLDCNANKKPNHWIGDIVVAARSYNEAYDHFTLNYGSTSWNYYEFDSDSEAVITINESKRNQPTAMKPFPVRTWIEETRVLNEGKPKVLGEFVTSTEQGKSYFDLARSRGVRCTRIEFHFITISDGVYNAEINRV